MIIDWGFQRSRPALWVLIDYISDGTTGLLVPEGDAIESFHCCRTSICETKSAQPVARNLTEIFLMLQQRGVWLGLLIGGALNEIKEGI
jgi:hypothetical protein